MNLLIFDGEKAMFRNNNELLYASSEHIIKELKEEDKLALRATNKQFNTILTNQQVGPYTTKVAFTIAAANQYILKENFDLGYFLYTSAINSPSNLPAMLYKLLDLDMLNSLDVLTRFAKTEDLAETARLYSPEKIALDNGLNSSHTWVTNQAWFMGQLHREGDNKQVRSFVLLSELTPSYIKRRNFPDKFSALSKEISLAIKLGYTAEINNENQVQLNPPSKSFITTKFSDLSLTDEEINNACELVSQLSSLKEQVKKFVFNLKPIITKIDSLNSFGFLMYELPKNEIYKSIDTIFVNKTVDLNNLIKQLQKQLPGIANYLQLPEISSMTLFKSDINNTDNVKKVIVATLSKYVEAKQQQVEALEKANRTKGKRF